MNPEGRVESRTVETEQSCDTKCLDLQNMYFRLLPLTFVPLAFVLLVLLRAHILRVRPQLCAIKKITTVSTRSRLACTSRYV